MQKSCATSHELQESNSIFNFSHCHQWGSHCGLAKATHTPSMLEIPQSLHVTSANHHARKLSRPDQVSSLRISPFIGSSRSLPLSRCRPACPQSVQSHTKLPIAKPYLLPASRSHGCHILRCANGNTMHHALLRMCGSAVIRCLRSDTEYDVPLEPSDANLSVTGG